MRHTTSSVLRLLLASWLLCSCGVLGAAEPVPLAMLGEDADAIGHALQALTRGDTAPLSALPSRSFTAAIGLADPAEPAVLRRWTLMLPQAMARVAPEQRAQVLASLDRLFASATGGDPNISLALAADFLPAPQAVTQLRIKADTAFDRGRLGEFLAAQRLLAQIHSTRDERESVALRLLGLNAETGSETEAEASVALQAPALDISRNNSVADHVPAPGLTVHWYSIPGWLLACNGGDRVLWQYRTGRSATILTGPGGALVRDVDGARLLDETGRVFPLPPLPNAATMLGLSGGAAWFGADRQVWRLDLASHAVRTLTLDVAPLGTPVARGSRSLWLASDRLMLVEGERIIARWMHDLLAGPGWRLINDWPKPNQVGIRAANGNIIPVKNLAEVLAKTASDPTSRAWFLAHAGLHSDALATLAEVGKSPAQLVVAAHLALGAEHVRATWKTLAPLAEKCEKKQALATVLAVALPDATAEQRLSRLLTEHPDLDIPPTRLRGVRWLDNPQTWEHALSGRAWLAGCEGSLAFLLHRDPASWRRVLPAEPLEKSADDTLTVRSDGGVTYRGRILQAERNPDLPLTVTCRDAARAAFWRHSWWPLPAIQALSTVITASDEVVFVMEGDARLSALDLASGELLARIAIPDGASNPSQMVVPTRDTIALLGPAGVDRQAWVIHADAMQTVLLPAPALWLLPLGGRAVVGLADGRALTLPDLTAVELPKDLVKKPRPIIRRDGLQHGPRIYPWASP